MLSIKSRDGTDMKVRITDNVAVFGVAKTELSEIKEGSYIGVTAMPEPDGTQKAVAVHIFPENQRGAAEGFRPWDQRPDSDHDQRHRRRRRSRAPTARTSWSSTRTARRKSWCRRIRRSSPSSPATSPN